MSAPLEVRPLGPGDGDALAELFTRNDRDAVTRTFDPFPLTADVAHRLAEHAGRDRCFGAFDPTGELVAMSMLRGWDEGFEIPSLGMLVDHEHHGRGIGGAVLDATIAAARGLGAGAVRLSVYATNPVAHRLYRGRGFTEIDRADVERAGGPDVRIVMLLEFGEDGAS